MEMPVFFQALVGAGAGALAAYVAIRSDLADLKARMNIVEQAASKSHDRIDKMMQS
jgi:hypothetical protein